MRRMSQHECPDAAGGAACRVAKPRNVASSFRFAAQLAIDFHPTPHFVNDSHTITHSSTTVHTKCRVPWTTRHGKPPSLTLKD